jgi:hypothetical protein
MGKLGHGFGTGIVGMNPLAFDIGHENIGPIQHTVARVDAAAAIEMDDELVSTNGFYGHGFSLQKFNAPLLASYPCEASRDTTQ